MKEEMISFHIIESYHIESKIGIIYKRSFRTSLIYLVILFHLITLITHIKQQISLDNNQFFTLYY